MVRTGKNECVVGSLAMLLGVAPEFIRRQICHNPPIYPFPAPWDEYPLVPSMEIICDWAYSHMNVAMVPFPYNPLCTPHEDCPPTPVWDDDADVVFEGQLEYGTGLIEGTVDGAHGHMVAWDGSVIYDPRGYCYSLNIAEKHGFTPARFWLCVKTEGAE
jgi:hypothetical protein